MTNDPGKSTDQAPRTSSGLSRRAALKRAAGAGIIMSSFSSGSALAAVSCKKFSNWASGGSPRLDDEPVCTQGNSPDVWKEEDDAAQLNILEAQFDSVFPGGTPDSTFRQILDGAGSSVEKEFAAAHLNAEYITGYPLTPGDVYNLWTKRNSPGFEDSSIETYLQTTY